MRRGFIRCLWGIPSHMYRRNHKVTNFDLQLVKYNPYEQPFTTYVYGERNYELLQKNGVTNCKLLSKEVSLWHEKIMKENKIDPYGHKLHALVEAAKDFDEFILLDWDCIPVKPLPENFWESFYNKQPIQAHLRLYGLKAKWIARKGALWRDKDINKRPCASFVYIRGKEIAEKIYNQWLSDQSQSDEKTLARVTDEIMGGWQGSNKYWELFEPNYFMLFRNEVRGQCHEKALLRQKDILFLHIHRQITKPCFVASKDMSVDEKRKYMADMIEQIIRRFLKSKSTNYE